MPGTLPEMSTDEALDVAILPGRFDPEQARNMAGVISLLRRAGCPYDTPGEFYAVAIRVLFRCFSPWEGYWPVRWRR